MYVYSEVLTSLHKCIYHEVYTDICKYIHADWLLAGIILRYVRMRDRVYVRIYVFCGCVYVYYMYVFMYLAFPIFRRPIIIELILSFLYNRTNFLGNLNRVV